MSVHKLCICHLCGAQDHEWAGPITEVEPYTCDPCFDQQQVLRVPATQLEAQLQRWERLQRTRSLVQRIIRMVA